MNLFYIAQDVIDIELDTFLVVYQNDNADFSAHVTREDLIRLRDMINKKLDHKGELGE